MFCISRVFSSDSWSITDKTLTPFLGYDLTYLQTWGKGTHLLHPRGWNGNRELNFAAVLIAGQHIPEVKHSCSSVAISSRAPISLGSSLFSPSSLWAATYMTRQNEISKDGKKRCISNIRGADITCKMLCLRAVVQTVLIVTRGEQTHGEQKPKPNKKKTTTNKRQRKQQHHPPQQRAPVHSVLIHSLALREILHDLSGRFQY